MHFRHFGDGKAEQEPCTGLNNKGVRLDNILRAPFTFTKRKIPTQRVRNFLVGVARIGHNSPQAAARLPDWHFGQVATPPHVASGNVPAFDPANNQRCWLFHWQEKNPYMMGSFLGGCGADRTRDRLLKRQLLYH